MHASCEFLFIESERSESFHWGEVHIFCNFEQVFPDIFINRNLSNRQIADELETNKTQIHEMTTTLRNGIVANEPTIELSGTVECDEVYVSQGTPRTGYDIHCTLSSFGRFMFIRFSYPLALVYFTLERIRFCSGLLFWGFWQCCGTSHNGKRWTNSNKNNKKQTSQSS